MSEISIVWEKFKFDSFTGGCYTPLTHAAIDRTLTTIFSFLPQWNFYCLTLKLLEKATSTGWTASVLSRIDTRNQIWTACGGFTLLLSMTTQVRAIFFAIVKTSHSGQWLFWHFIRLFDWRTPVLIQIDSLSLTEPGMAVLLHVTPAMSRKFRGDWSWSYFYGRSLFATDLCREVVIYWRNYEG